MNATKLSSMRMETKRFNKFARDYAKKAGQAHALTLRRLVLNLMHWIILAWPVDTGRSRAGWGLAAKLLGLQIPPEPKPEEAAKGFVAGNALITPMAFVAVNNLQYAGELENGSSQQAPAGVVRLSMRRLEAALGGRELPAQIQTVYGELWETGRLPTRAMQPGTGGGL